MTNLSKHTYACISNIYNYNLVLPYTSQKLLYFSPPWGFRYCPKGVSEERTISWGENDLRGLGSHERNKATSQAAVSVPRRTMSPRRTVGSLQSTGPSMLSWGLLSLLSSFSSCKSRLKSFSFTLYNEPEFAQNCSQYSLWWGFPATVGLSGNSGMCSDLLGQGQSQQIKSHSSHAWPGGAPCVRLTLQWHSI